MKELEGDAAYNAVFIRAPAITRIGEGVRSLASVKAAPPGEHRDTSAGLDGERKVHVAVQQVPFY